MAQIQLSGINWKAVKKLHFMIWIWKDILSETPIVCLFDNFDHFKNLFLVLTITCYYENMSKNSIQCKYTHCLTLYVPTPLKWSNTLKQFVDLTILWGWRLKG